MKISFLNSTTTPTSSSITTTGEGSDDISVYCCCNGKTISRGRLTDTPMNISYNKYNYYYNNTCNQNNNKVSKGNLIVIGKPNSTIYNLSLI